LHGVEDLDELVDIGDPWHAGSGAVGGIVNVNPFGQAAERIAVDALQAAANTTRTARTDIANRKGKKTMKRLKWRQKKKEEERRKKRRQETERRSKEDRKVDKVSIKADRKEAKMRSQTKENPVLTLHK